MSPYEQRVVKLLESIRTAAWWCAVPVVICACLIGIFLFVAFIGGLGNLLG